MPINTYSDISAFVNNIYEDALFAARENNLMAGLVLGFNNMTGLAARKSQEYNKGTAVVVAETDDLTSKSFTPAALSTLTPGEIGLQFFLTDSRVESDPFGVQQDTAVELGLAIADRIETDLLGDLASLTGGPVGGAGTVITWGHVFAALSQLKAAKAPAPYAMVLHPYQWHVLAKAVTVAGGAQTNAPAFQDAVMQKYHVQRVAGDLDIFVTSNLSIDGSNDVTSGMFSRPALALDVRRPLRIEPERDASRRGWELNASCVYAHGVWRPAFGVKMIFDAATPSS